MNTIQQNLLNPNHQPLLIGEFSIRQDEDGRYSLADLHKASGNLPKHKPSNFLRIEQTQELIKEIEQVSDMSIGDAKHFSNMRSAVKVINGGNQRGTYAVKELVYSYAMWISAKFHLMVIRAYDSLVMEWMLGGKQTISPEQCGILYNIVHTRAGENKNLIVQMWSRLKNHFKYSASYRELRAIHFEDAKHYLEVMELKVKTTEKEPEKHKDTEPHILAVLQDQNVQFLMWYVPILVKYIKDEVYPALTAIQSGYAGHLSGLASEAVCHANLLNRKAVGCGITQLRHVGNRPPHSMEWYLSK